MRIAAAADSVTKGLATTIYSTGLVCAPCKHTFNGGKQMEIIYNKHKDVRAQGADHHAVNEIRLIARTLCDVECDCAYRNVLICKMTS